MSITDPPVLIALGLTLLAGLSTCIGSAIAFIARPKNTTFLAVSLGFAAGAMLYVSFIEVMPKAVDKLTNLYGELGGQTAATLAFFAGVIVTLLIDRFVPSSADMQRLKVDPTQEAAFTVEPVEPVANNRPQRLMRIGLISALALAIHNFPEGAVTFLGAIEDPRLGFALATAIAVHNIPEGIAVSIPVFYATGSRRLAFWYSAISGLAEPVGAVIAFFLLQSLLSGPAIGIAFAAVAGIMVFVSLDGLLPTAREYDRSHNVLYGLLAGMAVMAASLLLLKL